MEILRQTVDPAPLVQWGRPYNAYKDAEGIPAPEPGGQVPLRVLPIVSEPICPECKKFSYHLLPSDNFSKHAATLWARSVIGFVPEENSGRHAGIVTIFCPECNAVFGFRIMSISVDFYRNNCPSWPKETVEPASASPVFKRNIQLLRRTAMFKHDHLDDMSFLAELDRLEAPESKK